MITNNYWENLKFQNLNIQHLDTLPVTHNTEFEHFINMLKTTTIEAKEVNEPFTAANNGSENIEKRMFVYYGVPLYVPKTLFPSIFAFKITENRYNQFDWYPMDTGALNYILDSFKDSFPEDYSAAKYIEEFSYQCGYNSEAIKAIKEHIAFIFKDNPKYVEGESIEADSDPFPICFHRLNTIFEKLKAQDVLTEFKKFLKEKGLVVLDGRVRIVEGNSISSFSLFNTDLVFCHIPKQMKHYIPEDLRKNAEISEYDRSQDDNETIIKEGFEKYKAYLEKQHPKINFSKQKST